MGTYYTYKPEVQKVKQGFTTYKTGNAEGPVSAATIDTFYNYHMHQGQRTIVLKLIQTNLSILD